MFKSPSDRPTFFIQFFDCQNNTWQGELTWVNSGKKVPFRSMLELVRLIDSAVAAASVPDKPAKPSPQ